MFWDQFILVVIQFSSASMIDFSVVKNWWKVLVKYRNQDVIETGISKARVQNVQTYLEQLAASEW